VYWLEIREGRHIMIADSIDPETQKLIDRGDIRVEGPSLYGGIELSAEVKPQRRLYAE
jgi:hypothetical protein